MKIRVHIERLVVDAGLGGQTPHPILLRDAIRAELRSLAGGTAPVRPVKLGSEIAKSIYQSVEARLSNTGKNV